MKAAFNGVPQISVLDGWWAEAWNRRNGWAIGENVHTPDPEQEDIADAESIYQILENHVVPLYYDRDRQNIPHALAERCERIYRCDLAIVFGASDADGVHREDVPPCRFKRESRLARYGPEIEDDEPFRRRLSHRR